MKPERRVTKAVEKAQDKEAPTNWSSHKGARQGAALAYYSVFSLGPIIVIAIAVAGLLFGRDAVTSQVMSSIKEMLGAEVIHAYAKHNRSLKKSDRRQERQAI